MAGLVAAAFGAGWVDAVVGGGGLIQLPALLLLLPGASPVQVLATNKLAGVFGTSTSAATYLRRISPSRSTALAMVPAALAGAVAGALLASLVPARLFRVLVLLLVLGVGSYVLRRPELGRVRALRWAGGRHLAVAAAVAAVIGCYDGAFGPGTGSFLVFALVGLLGFGFLEGSALARLTNAATNLGALAVFVPQGAPLWSAGLLMAVASAGGAWIGARTAIARGNRFVRAVFLVVVAALALRLGWAVLRGR